MKQMYHTSEQGIYGNSSLLSIDLFHQIVIGKADAVGWSHGKTRGDKGALFWGEMVSLKGRGKAT